MKYLSLLTTVLLAIGVVAYPTSGFVQVKHGAVVLNGLIADEFKSPAGRYEGKMFPLDTFGPGIEYRTNPRGRVSWGIGYNRQNAPSQTITDLTRTSTDSMGNLILHTLTNEVAGAKLDVISVTAYINILTRNIVQPFIGIGGGVRIAEAEGTFTFTDVLFPQFSEQFPISEKTYDAVLKGVMGASVFPVDRLIIISGGGGYQNGGMGFFQVGVVF